MDQIGTLIVQLMEEIVLGEAVRGANESGFSIRRTPHHVRLLESLGWDNRARTRQAIPVIRDP